MAMLDTKLVLSDSQSVVLAVSSTLYSTNIIDTGAGENFYHATKNQNPGVGNPEYLNVICEDEAWVVSGAGTTVALSLVSGTANNGTNVSAGVLTHITKTITVANAVDGAMLLSIPLPVEAMGRYLQVKLVTDSTVALTAGKMTAWLGDQMATPEALK